MSRGKATQDAAAWLRDNDPKRAKPPKKVRKARAEIGTPVPESRHGHYGKNGLHPREAMAGGFLPTVKAEVEANKGATSAECIFVQTSVVGRVATVRFHGRTLSAARYMCTLKHGAPNSDGMVVRHLCGNGHLNCINPNHVVWGAPGDNQADANKHRALGVYATEQDKIHAID